jgi:predicted metal-binding membrane protein
VLHSVLRRTTPQLVALLLLAGLASAWTVSQARSMGSMPGAMGLGLPAFVVMWTAMMAAMMLPSVAPFGSLYARTVQTRRPLRLGLFVLGYLLVWGAAGVPAYGLAWLAGEAAGHGEAGTAMAVAIFAIAGVYQLTSLKTRCLAHCRSPIAHVFHYASFSGPLRDLKAGIHNGYFCFGCCWSLMLLLVAFGVMNVYGMVALAAVVAVEKLTPAGERFSRAVGVGLLMAAAAVVWVPGLAPGLAGAGR